jgi:hypothetical protein
MPHVTHLPQTPTLSLPVPNPLPYPLTLTLHQPPLMASLLNAHSLHRPKPHRPQTQAHLNHGHLPDVVQQALISLDAVGEGAAQIVCRAKAGGDGE